MKLGYLHGIEFQLIKGEKCKMRAMDVDRNSWKITVCTRDPRRSCVREIGPPGCVRDLCAGRVEKLESGALVLRNHTHTRTICYLISPDKRDGSIWEAFFEAH